MYCFTIKSCFNVFIELTKKNIYIYVRSLTNFC